MKNKIITIDGHIVEVDQKYIEETWRYVNELETKLQKMDNTQIMKFIQWIGLQGYYIGCYGEVMTDEEIETLIKEYKIFEEKMKDE